MKKCFVCGACRQTDPERRLFQFPKGSFFYICDKHIPSELRTNFFLKPGSYKHIELILKRDNLFPEKLNNCVPSSKTNSHRRCILKHCINSNKTIKLFKFPDNKSDYQVWVQNCNLLHTDDEKKKIKYLCEKHFHSHDILKKKLKKGSVPLFNLNISNIEDVEPPDSLINNNRENISLPGTSSAICYGAPNLVETKNIVDVYEYPGESPPEQNK